MDFTVTEYNFFYFCQYIYILTLIPYIWQIAEKLNLVTATASLLHPI